MPRVEPASFLTLHYRLAGPQGDVINTFAGRPATLSLGAGELAPAVEQRLLGLEEGARTVFEIPAGEAYGERQPTLVVRLSRGALAQATPQAVDSLAVGDPLEVTSPDGKRVVATVREIDSDTLTLDFNHPLAGQAMRFVVRLIGIL